MVGLLEREGEVFTKPVDGCTKEELLPVILSKVKEGVDVFTDGWRGYDGLAMYGFNHKKVKHEKNESSAGGGHHINGIESFWSFAKHRLSRFNGVPERYFSAYLKETSVAV